MNQGTNLGSQIGRWIVLAALVAVLGALLFLLPGGLVQAQDSTTIEYTENGKDAVVTLSAGDPEGATPITWSLVPAAGLDVDNDGTIATDGTGGDIAAADAEDMGVFKISQSGVLEFKSPPDYDDPGDDGDDNIYYVVVQASDGDAGDNASDGTAEEAVPGVNMVDDDETRSWFKVIVNVRDINEPGSIKLHPTEHAGATLLQPQIGVEITAANLMDEDGTTDTGISTVTGEEATYQWQRSSSMNGLWGNITLPTDDTTPATYLPRQVDGGARDLGQYLRVVATYTEAGTGGRGGQRAIATSMYPTIKVVGDNNAPWFTEGDDTADGGATTRSVRENRGDTNIGAPVAATNPEGSAPHNEELTYWLSGAEAGAVSTALGKITETLTPAPVEAQIETSDTATEDNYVHGLFSIDPVTGQLMTKGPLNYERDPNDDDTLDPYYAVIVNVADSASTTDAVATDAITVIIRVLQTNDGPAIMGASTIEHVEGETALDTNLGNTDVDVATYDATDEDPTDTTLEFSLEGADKDLFNLRDTTDAEEMDDNATPPGTTRQVLEFKEKPDYENPMDSNKDNVYQVTIKVFDGEGTTTKDVTVKVTNKQEDGKVAVTPLQARIGVELTATLTDSDIVSYGPTWRWQHSGLSCADHVTVADGDWDNIPGATSAAFTPRDIDLSRCLRAVATYNDGYHEYVTAPDPVSGPSASGLYTTTDTRFDKTADKSLSSVQYPTEPNVTPKFSSTMTKRFVLENGAANNPVGRPVTATDGNGPDDALTYTLSGATDEFSIHPQTGQLMTMTRMGFDHETKDKYTVTVTATDTHQASASIDVDIYVVDVDEMPVGNMPPVEGIEYTENGKDAVVTLSAGDPEGATPITWSLVPAAGLDVDNDGTIATDGTGGDIAAADAEDMGVFKISQSGVLEFKSPPDYDDPGDDGDDNIYYVVVQASDGDAGDNASDGTAEEAVPGVNMVDDDETRSWFKVIVNVRDINEPGSIKLHPTEHAGATLLQPQIGVEITAANLMDEDGTTDTGISTVTGEEATYQWQRSSSMNGPWENITLPTDDTTPATYLPRQVDGGERDLGQYLRVVATYTEAGAEGLGGQEAIATSMYPTIQVVGDNNDPSFTEGDDTADGGATTRHVRENRGDTNIGVPVAATNPEGIAPHNEKLTYWLSGAEAGAVSTALGKITETLTPAPVEAQIETSDTATEDNYVHGLFSIDPVTGQLMTKGPLNYERDPNDDDTLDPYYAVIVNVADSASTTDAVATDAITVIIRVLQTNDGPAIMGASTIEHVEGETALDTNLGNTDVDVATYDATDEDPTDTTLEFSLEGADKDLFNLRDTTDAEEMDDNATPPGTTRQVLEFKEKPDYENPMDSNKDNVYQVTIKVFDGEGTTTKDVTVKVTNKQEDGKVAVTPLQARIGVELTATLTDSDIVSYGPTWRWQHSGLSCADHVTVADGDWDNIPGATSAAFTPRDIDLSRCLRAVATYNDGYHEYVTAPDPVSGPSASGLYTTTDTRFDKTADKSLSSVQYPTEPNVTPKFSSTMTKRFVLENGAANNPVGRPVTATDGNGPDDALTYTLSGATDEFSIRPTTGQLMTKMKFDHESEDKYTVTVTATDTHQASASIDVDIYVVDVDEMPQMFESGLAISGASSVNYMENGTGAAATYTASGPMADNAKWTLMGDDMGDLSISPSGVLTFDAPPDYEMPMDADTDNQYMVTVKAEAGGEMGEITVTVTVDNVDELGTLSGDSSPSYEEGGEGAVGTYTASGGSMSDMATWTLMGDDMGDLSISPSGVLTFDATPNYEMPMDEGMDNTYMVTVKAEAGGEMKMMPVTVTVTNEDEDGMVTLMPMRPSVGTEITATLIDEDIVTGNTVTWQWSRSMTMGGTYMDIDTATSMTYTPVADDEDHYLKATASYTDSYGSGKMADEMTESPVSLFAIDGPTSHSYMENGTDAVATYTATGDAVTTWTLEGADAGDFTIPGGMLRFMSSPNYEMPMDADTNNVYMVTVKASDSTNMDTKAVTVTVTNEEEAGTVRLMPASPRVDTAVTAALTDPDGTTTIESWDWLISGTENGIYTAIPGAITAMYTPTAEDATKYIKARAMYADPEGANKVADSDPAMVTVADPLLAEYDANSNGTIERSEVIAAINRYLDGEAGITRADVIAVINLYLDS